MKDNGFKLTAELLKKKLLKDVKKERCLNISGVPPRAWKESKESG